MSEKLSPKENLLASRFDLIMVMGSPFELDPDGKPHYSLFNPGFGELNQDGDLKAEAIQQLYLYGMTPRVLVTGGIQNGISRAEELVKHTNQQYGVPLEFMIPLTSAPHSLGNLEETIKYLDASPALTGELGILTISAHLLRTREMVDYLNLPQTLGKNPRYLSVEFLLRAAGKKSVEKIREFYMNEKIVERIISEHQGIADLRANKYTPRS